MEGIAFERGEYGCRAVVTTGWSEEFTKHLVDAGTVELELNDGKGWRGNDLSFLSALPELRLLKVIDLKIASVEPIHYLHRLSELEVITYCNTEISFSAFPQLERCALEWRPKASSVFDCKTLKELFVNGYEGKDVLPFAKLHNLESLSILNAPTESLLGLGALKKLRLLRLGRLKRLKSLTGIEELSTLEELEIHTCQGIGSIKEVGSLSRLRKLYLNNDGVIDSLKPLERLEGLESVLFYESTNILDGDLSPVMKQRNLTRVSFQNRRHYSTRREDFGVAYSGMKHEAQK